MSVIEDLIKAISGMETGILRETLAHLLKIYVIDRGLSYEGIQNQVHSHKTAGESFNQKSPSFVELIQDLKNRYTMEELHQFSVEGNAVFITIDGNKYQIAQGNPVKNTNDNPGEKKVDDTSPDNRISADGQSPCGRFEKLELE
jgi:hypothetical protein